MHGKQTTRLIYIILALATIFAFEPVRLNDFIYYDDDQYVTDNPHVQAGLTRDSIIWAFTTDTASNWHPLTWLSHMLDCQLFGVHPAWHHLISVLIHTASALLLLRVLHVMTGALWRSAFVAVIFALHPLRVESVAWVAERKDVLCSLFWMLTIIAYVRYAKSGTWNSYLWVVVSFGVGLMAKPMLVTLPFVLLLLDYWPLRRASFARSAHNQAAEPIEPLDRSRSTQSIGWLVLEKIPLITLVVISSAVTFIIQQRSGAVTIGEDLPLNLRVPNALLSYVAYIGKIFYPHALAVLYPHSFASPALWKPVVCLLVLSGTSALAFLAGPRHGYLAVGWFWYLGTLVPVIGLIQVGSQAMADRYTYLPSIGLTIMVAWGAASLRTKWRYLGTVLAITTGIILVALLVTTRAQVQRWRDSITLFEYTLSVTQNNHVILNNLGVTFKKEQRLDEAVALFQKALHLYPKYANAHNNLANTLRLQGKHDEAMHHFRRVLQFTPDEPSARYNLSVALALEGQHEQAIDHLRRLTERYPDDEQAHNQLAKSLIRLNRLNEAAAQCVKALAILPQSAGLRNILGNTLRLQGKNKDAISQFRQVLKLAPDSANIHNNLANTLKMDGQIDEAIYHYHEALRLNPNYADAHYNLANTLMSTGRLDEAIEYYIAALVQSPNQIKIHNNLGLAFKSQGKLASAIKHYREALALDGNDGQATNNLKSALGMQQDLEQAIVGYRKALTIATDDTEVRYKLALTLTQLERMDEALDHFDHISRLHPDWPDPLNNIAWILATTSDPSLSDLGRAVDMAKRAAEITEHQRAEVLDTLAVAYAAAGRFNLAVKTAKSALALLSTDPNQLLLLGVQMRLDRYRLGEPFVEQYSPINSPATSPNTTR